MTLPAFAAPPLFGSTGQAMVIFSGGSASALEATARTAGGSGVWVQDAIGAFRLLIVNGPAFVNAAFFEAFATGIPGPRAATLTR